MHVLRMEPQEPTPALIVALVKDHRATSAGAYHRLQDYYEGRHDILARKAVDSSKPNNKLVHNFPGYIVDVSAGYFLGRPVSYTSQDKTFMEALQGVFDQNDEAAENMELAKTAGIKGTAFELLYADDSPQARPCFGMVRPEQTILAYDTSIDPQPTLALRYYHLADPLTGEKVYHYEFYTDKQVWHYEGKGEDALPALAKGWPKPQMFGAVPIIEYPNNDERQGDFEKVLSLIDAYDLAESDTANDHEYHTDAYLVFKNMSGTKDADLTAMKRDRVILIDGDGEASWLLKEVNDVAQENYKKRLQGDIHLFSQTPRLTDEAFAGTLSGVAIAYKLWGLEQSAAQKERKFKKALQRRLLLLANFLRLKGSSFDWRDVSLTFSRNMPQNVQELATVVQGLKGIVSDQTLLALLPFIEDVGKELERLEVQNEGRVDLDDAPPVVAPPIAVADQAARTTEETE